jgi:tRNA/rRNA methyltransferase
MMAASAGVVDFGDEVVDLLLRDAHGFDVQRGAVDDGAGGAGGLDGHVEHGVQVGGRHKLFRRAGGLSGDAGARQWAVFSNKDFTATPSHATRFILINTSHAGNVGAAARAMKVMGFDDLVLVAPRWANVLRREETIQRASGALDVLTMPASWPRWTKRWTAVTHLCATAMTPRDFGPPTLAPRDHFAALLAPQGPQCGLPVWLRALWHDQRRRVPLPCGAEHSDQPRLWLAQPGRGVQVIAYEWRMALGGFAVQPSPPSPCLPMPRPWPGCWSTGSFAGGHRLSGPGRAQEAHAAPEPAFQPRAGDAGEVHILRGVAKAMAKAAQGKAIDWPACFPTALRHPVHP